MTIYLSRIEFIFQLIINQLKSNGIHEISFDDDYYWNVPSDLLYDPYNQPKELDIGQLSEDYEFLLSSIKNDCIVNADLRKLSHLLRYIADKLDAKT